MLKVKLSSVINAMGFQNEDIIIVLDTWNSEILSFEVKNSKIDNVYDKIDNGEYITLPCNYDIDENAIILDFVKENEGVDITNFKESLRKNSLTDKWNEYRDKIYKELAIEWCEENNIEYM